MPLFTGKELIAIIDKTSYKHPVEVDSNLLVYFDWEDPVYSIYISYGNSEKDLKKHTLDVARFKTLEQCQQWILDNVHIEFKNI